MGMGYGANYADVVEEAFVKKHARKEFNGFMKAIDKHLDGDLQSFYDLEIQGSGDAGKEVTHAYHLLQEAFEKKTGLNLELDYHGDDEGDRYDDVVLLGCGRGVGNDCCGEEVSEGHSAQDVCYVRLATCHLASLFSRCATCHLPSLLSNPLNPPWLFPLGAEPRRGFIFYLTIPFLSGIIDAIKAIENSRLIIT
jgi:hypothetical protein